ncbi:MAG: MarR family transcriptional regulator [Hyphomonadaceae bacterium]|nr:MarR family transcriptional regulator [Hyphomonadaceae bacterium]
MSKLRLSTFLPYRLSIASNAVSKAIAAAYTERFRLSIPEWRLIAILHEVEDATQQDLVRATLMDKVAVSRAAQMLEENRLVARRQDARDGRALRIRLSERGRALYRRIEPTALEYERRLLAAFGKEEIAQLSEMLGRLAEAAGRLADEDAAD